MKHLFCPKCKKVFLLGTWEEATTKFCKTDGSGLYPIKNINGTDVNAEDL